MADEIEREVACQDTTVSFTAQEIINAVTRGVANLRLGLLVRWTVRVLEERAVFGAIISTALDTDEEKDNA